MTQLYAERTDEYIGLIERELDRLIPGAECLQGRVMEAMRYSAANGGKRVRPILTLEFARLCGLEVRAALPFACAVEMIHTYSLIHDDLPCMDNDDMRRGKPSCHIEFGEDTALLAGDGLLTLAFEVMLREYDPKCISPRSAITAAALLASNSGVNGMIGGQVIDLMSEGKTIDIETLRTMDRLKTGALIDAACRMGCVIAGAPREKLDAAGSYAAALGLAFQIVDDILDVTGSTEELGKPVGSDAENKKSTYVSLLGLDACRDAVRRLTDNAVRALAHFEGGTEYLAELAENLATRKN
ncbi:MAG TPA: polyprenyl synthetase family protein [Candidatus Onthovicinus excrementipullorum]|nr:polyprenyl synthetase family protein [Candidatus Onthovicinus excrementipullorum]